MLLGNIPISGILFELDRFLTPYAGILFLALTFLAVEKEQLAKVFFMNLSKGLGIHRGKLFCTVLDITRITTH